jgi:transcriptional regulator with XRE-family HTH domain
MPKQQYSLNADVLHAAAKAAGHVRDDGTLDLQEISRHINIDRSSLYRVVRDENGPDLGTVFELAAYTGLPVERLVKPRTVPRPRKARASEMPECAA